MVYKCIKCNKEFKFKSILLRHENSKNSCIKEKIDLNCKICNTNFRCKTEYLRHEKTKKHIININNIGIDIDIDINNNIDNSIHIMNTINIQNTNGLNTFIDTNAKVIDFEKINNIFSDRNFRKNIKDLKNLNENYDNINHKDECEFYIDYLIRIFKEINFNEQHKENHNCKILAFYNTTDRLISLNYLILDKDLENLFYWNQISYNDFLTLLLNFMNIIKDYCNNDNLIVIMNYLNKHLLKNNNLYNEIKKEIEEILKDNDIAKFCNLSYNNNRDKASKEINIFCKKQTKLLNGDQPKINWIKNTNEVAV